MYDKIKLYLPKCRGMPDISQYLDNGGEKTNIITGETSTFGFVNNMRINQFVGGYVVSGSLSGFLYDNNLYPLDYDSGIMLAWTKLKLGKTAEAKVLFQHTLTLRPNDSSSLEGLKLIK